MKMNSTCFAVSLAMTLLLHSVVAVSTNDSKTPKFSETSSKYASPQLYVFGGYDTHVASLPAQYLSSASHFNSSSGKWEETTGMSIARYEFCGAVVGTKIYLFGGTNGSHFTNSSIIYDCETKSYSPFQIMPSQRGDCGAAVLGDFIYVSGEKEGSEERFKNVIRYNINTGRRENVSSMIYPRVVSQLVELNGLLYAIGGSGPNSKTVEAYNETTNRWTAMANSSYQHFDFGVAVHEGKIYVCSDKGFEVYFPETDQWQSLDHQKNCRGSTLVTMNDQLWSLGGEDSGITSKSVFTYNPSTKKWTQQADMTAYRSYFTAFVVNH